MYKRWMVFVGILSLIVLVGCTNEIDEIEMKDKNVPESVVSSNPVAEFFESAESQSDVGEGFYESSSNRLIEITGADKITFQMENGQTVEFSEGDLQ